MSRTQPYTGLQAEGSEMFYMDPRIYNGRDVGFARINLRYSLFQQSRIEIVRRVEFFTLLTVGVPKYAVHGVMTIADAKTWLVTLVTPSGEIMVNQMPITRLMSQQPGAGFKQQRPSYFDRTMLVDARQSYIESVRPGQLAFIPYQLTYAR